MSNQPGAYPTVASSSHEKTYSSKEEKERSTEKESAPNSPGENVSTAVSTETDGGQLKKSEDGGTKAITELKNVVVNLKAVSGGQQWFLENNLWLGLVIGIILGVLVGPTVRVNVVEPPVDWAWSLFSSVPEPAATPPPASQALSSGVTAPSRSPQTTTSKAPYQRPLLKAALVFGPSFRGAQCPHLACLGEEEVLSYLQSALPGWKVATPETPEGNEDAVLVGFRQTARLQLRPWEIDTLNAALGKKKKAVVVSFQNAYETNFNKCEVDLKGVNVVCLLYDHTSGHFGTFPGKGTTKHQYNQNQLALLRQLLSTQ